MGTMRRGYGFGGYGLGALTPDQIAQANQQLEAIASRLTAQVGIIRAAQEQGFDAHLLDELRGTHGQLLASLQYMMDEAPGLSSDAFAEWLQRMQGLAGQVQLFEERVRGGLTRVTPQRTARIVASTIGALALAGVLAGVVWYASAGGAARVLARRSAQKRRRR